ncbi:hypothetical protein [Pseudovibrio sp. Tun.PSC04-5.I4]|uniref:hypothetical protein n=1 Tax=Pseudovibrio sp. Tun.PSC04-5.I4 TaxID=1798213 RepID=UPI00087E727D|nr:hypothetical protein [Pseudovibrio sp. Tun.PSC04-5.I4]SDR08191.1 hypothetical protein SAMN04515695_2658 [Pseudovibrio sp. Tun.PSC04-5.I4]
MSTSAYVLRQYSLQPGFIYFVGDWDKPRFADGSFHIIAKTSVKLEDANLFTREADADQWALFFNKNQPAHARAWQVMKITIHPGVTAVEPRKTAAMGGAS